MSQLRWRFVVPGGLLLANVVVLATEISWLRLVAGLALLFILPGLAWLQALNWFGTWQGVERIVLGAGFSVAIASIALLGAVYWPGPWALSPTLIALDVATLMGVAFGLLNPARPESGKLVWPSLRISVALLVILCVAGFLRWYAIGYGEFHEDELENVRLAVRAMGGEEYAPFLDSKGPVHWLLPGSLWLLRGWGDEAIARTPFAICSMLSLLAVYALGRRMDGPTVGVIGAGFAAINGFFVAYARYVENPSLIILWGILAAWCAYRFYQERIASLQILGGLFLGIGLVAHPDVLLFLPPFGFMLALTYWRGRGQWQGYWKSLLAGLLLFVSLTLVFYVPYVRDPNFELTQEYFAAERIGTQVLYNRVASMLEQDRLYSTRYYAPLLIIFSGIVIVRELRRLGRAGLLLSLLVAAAIVSTVLVPGPWEWGAVSLAFLPYVILFAVLSFSPLTSFEVKSLVLWFGIPFLALQFLAKDAADHIQIAYPAWSLLAAMGLQLFWNRLAGTSGRIQPLGLGWGRIVILGVLVCALGLTLYYQHLQFVGTVTNYWRAEADAKYNPDSIYRLLYGGLPRPRKLFSNPRLGGWKVVGYLYDNGQLKGDFRSINESFAVPIWYTHQTPRSCFSDPQNYFVRIDARGVPEEVDQLLATGYGLTRIVRVDHQPKLYLFEKGVSSSDEPEIYDVGDYRRLYDRSATPERYVQGKSPEHPLRVMFGDKLLLTGYDIDSTRLAPGETLALTLHWQVMAPMDIRYRAFVHIETDRMWGQHDDDPVCRVRTDEWRPPQTGAGQFRVTLDPATPPGTYPVTVGVYNPENWERLEIADEGGQPLGNVLEVTTISVE
ncbi:MAG: glycosyltransferase family 39 protein [Anaerolineales bacterium]|nr:MAG: glycosyltransferase family 39 protein [Anaerolineales bacterium]